jgi:Domain of unknown function (DUF1707)
VAGEVSPSRRPGDRQNQAELRASHTDRDLVVEQLRDAAGDGRLTADELDQRLEAALTARTYGELAVLTADLPASGQLASPGMPSAKDLIRIECASGTARRDGQWVVPRHLEVRVASGHVRLDLTRAVISQPELDVDVSVRSGMVTLVTRPGIVVDADDVSVRSGRVNVRQQQGVSAPVILRVRVTGTVASGAFRARPPRRTLLQWLLRRPSTSG